MIRDGVLLLSRNLIDIAYLCQRAATLIFLLQFQLKVLERFRPVLHVTLRLLLWTDDAALGYVLNGVGHAGKGVSDLKFEATHA